MHRVWAVATLASITLLNAACVAAGRDGTATDAVNSRRDIEVQLGRYLVAARAVDAAATAAFFTDSGTLFEPGIVPIVTRDSIRAFVASFPGVQVDSATATGDVVDVFGGTALMWGSYFERLRFPGQPASAQHGRFVMEWRRGDDGQWRIHRYYRVPLPEPVPPTSRAK